MMTLFRLDERRRLCVAFGVAGTDAHVGLLANDQELCEGDQPRVHHVIPPQQFDGTMMARYIGHLDDLSKEEIQDLQVWITRHRDTAERMALGRRDDYILIPHFQERRDPNTNHYIRTVFSCSGFVFEAYRAIDVLLVDNAGLPLSSALDLENIWGAPHIRIALATQLLPEDRSTWNILLPAHILQSLARPQPRSGPHYPTHNRVPDC